MSTIQIHENSPGLSDVPGFETAATACDIRELGQERLDLALVYSPTSCTAAGVFTQNDIIAAPVKLCQKNLQAGSSFHGIIINSGNANACTGEQGMNDAITMIEQTAQACNQNPDTFFVCSTGRIGRALPMPTIQKGIARVAAEKANSAEQSQQAADAILTSDTRSKTITASFEWEGKKVTLAGMAKGAGMIEPNMATMLAFVTTDAEVPQAVLQECLNNANTESFNAITVDGDMSTNDTVLLLANGASGVAIDTINEGAGPLFKQALDTICQSLAKKIVGDGEKVTKLVTLKVEGAPSVQAAEKVARAIGNSLLVKTSWYGSDPNWGRVIDAAGYARIGIIEEKIDFYYDHCPVIVKGNPIHGNLDQWKAIVAKPDFTIQLNLNLGPASYQLLSSDLSEAYVDFNKSE